MFPVRRGFHHITWLWFGPLVVPLQVRERKQKPKTKMAQGVPERERGQTRMEASPSSPNQISHYFFRAIRSPLGGVGVMPLNTLKWYWWKFTERGFRVNNNRGKNTPRASLTSCFFWPTLCVQLEVLGSGMNQAKDANANLCRLYISVVEMTVNMTYIYTFWL